MTIKQILIIHSTTDDVAELAQGLQSGLEEQGFQVDLAEITDRTRPLSLVQYDLVFIGSPALGFLGGEIDDQVESFLGQCKRISGQEMIAFVSSKLLGAGKSVKKLMSKLEQEGAFVKDFRVFKNYRQAKNYALDLSL